jgi:hypothetical protein
MEWAAVVEIVAEATVLIAVTVVIAEEEAIVLIAVTVVIAEEEAIVLIAVTVVTVVAEVIDSKEVEILNNFPVIGPVMRLTARISGAESPALVRAAQARPSQPEAVHPNAALVAPGKIAMVALDKMALADPGKIAIVVLGRKHQ